MDEAKLVLALRDRDPTAARDLLSEYGERLLRSAFLLCGNEAEAQDLVQETFLQALQSIQRFRGQSCVYTWLQGILLNLNRHYHRERRRMIFDEALVERTLGAAEDPPLTMDVAASTSAVAQALTRLSRAHREVLVLRFYENMKLDEIARQLGISRGTVKSRLHYALEQMHRLLPTEMNLFGAGGT